MGEIKRLAILKTSNEFYRGVTEISKKSKEIFIATYNIHTDLGKNKAKENKAYQFLNRLHKRKAVVNILVGAPYIKDTDKRESYHKWRGKFFEHKRNWPNFNWYMSHASHSKFMVFKPKNICIIGSRNLSDSTYREASVVYKDEGLAVDLIEQFDSIASNDDVKWDRKPHKYYGHPVKDLPTKLLKWVLDLDSWNGPPEIYEVAREEIERRIGVSKQKSPAK